MGLIANRLKAQLDEMRTRHAATDREINRLREQAWQDFRALEAAQEALERELGA